MIYKIVFRNALIPEVGNYLRTTRLLPASMITPGVSLRNENLGRVRALDEMETGGETSSAREEHIIS